MLVSKVGKKTLWRRRKFKTWYNMVKYGKYEGYNKRLKNRTLWSKIKEDLKHEAKDARQVKRIEERKVN